MLPLGSNAGPSTLFLGEPEAVAGAPVWPWALLGVVLVAAVAVALLARLRQTRQPPAARAADKLARHHAVDAKTRRALDRCARQLGLASPAGLLASPTALAEAIGRCGSLKESDKSRLRELAIKVAQEFAGRSVSMPA